MLNLRSEGRIQSIIKLYGEHLSDVSFPQVDHQILLKEEQKLLEIQSEIKEYEVALEKKKTIEQSVFLELEALGERALSYAHVFALDDQLLLEKCEALSIQNKKSPKTKRKVKAKSKVKKEVHHPEVIDTTKLEAEEMILQLSEIGERHQIKHTLKEQDLSADLLLQDEVQLIDEEFSQEVFDDEN